MSDKDTLKLGRRILRVGEVIKIKGAGGEFTICSFGAGTVSVYGGPAGRPMFRTFTIERIGARPRITKIRQPRGTVVKQAPK